LQVSQLVKKFRRGVFNKMRIGRAYCCTGGCASLPCCKQKTRGQRLRIKSTINGDTCRLFALPSSMLNLSPTAPPHLAGWHLTIGTNYSHASTLFNRLSLRSFNSFGLCLPFARSFCQAKWTFFLLRRSRRAAIHKNWSTIRLKSHNKTWRE